MKKSNIIIRAVFSLLCISAMSYIPTSFATQSASKQTQVSTSAKKILQINVPSSSMNKIVPTVVVLPDSYFTDTQKRFPVMYLLHGHGGNQMSWVRIRPDIQKLASSLNMIVVCPDGNKSSWYWDSPMDSKSRYETFVSKELIDYIDSNYRTKASRNDRAITGLSMGGHGGLFLGIRHQDIFGACGSMSGGVDIRPFPRNWGMAAHLGDMATNPDNWERLTVMNQLHLLKPNSIRIAFECGVDDFFYEINERLHRELLYRNIPHDYTVRPGKHNSPYWNNALPYQMWFFSTGFSK